MNDNNYLYRRLTNNTYISTVTTDGNDKLVVIADTLGYILHPAIVLAVNADIDVDSAISQIPRNSIDIFINRIKFAWKILKTGKLESSKTISIRGKTHIESFKQTILGVCQYIEEFNLGRNDKTNKI